MTGVLSRSLQAHVELFRGLDVLSASVEKAGELIAESLRSGHKLMICGNGGSAADSQHIAAELTGRFLKDRRPLAAIALSTDTSALTAIANDHGFDAVFQRQVVALGRSGDSLLAISTSGNSRNVIRAAEAAHEVGVHTIGLLGRDGGQLLRGCDVAIVVPSDDTARIQEAHIFIGHTLCELIEEKLHLR